MKTILNFFGFSQRNEAQEKCQSTELFEIQMSELQEQIALLIDESQKKDCKLLLLQDALMQKNLQLISIQKVPEQSIKKRSNSGFTLPMVISCDQALPDHILKKKEQKQLEKAFEVYEINDKLNFKLPKDIYDFIQILHAHTKIAIPKIEQFVFTKIYDTVFNQDEDTQARGIQIFEKLQVLQNIITPELLGVDSKVNIPSILNYLQNGIILEKMRKINEKKTPIQKLNVIKNIVNNILSIIVYFVYGIILEIQEKSLQDRFSADQLFPIIVYVILISNPTDLAANIEFIDKFINKNQLYGEYGYLLTTLCAATSFLERVDGNALNQGRLEIGLLRYNSQIEFDNQQSTNEEQKEELLTLEREEDKLERKQKLSEYQKLKN